MSAIADSNDEAAPLIRVLFLLHPGFDTLDVVGPLEVMSYARHNMKDECKHFRHSKIPSILADM